MNRNFFGMTGGAAVVLVFFGALGVGCTATVGQQAAGEVVGGLLCLVIGLPVGLLVASYLEHRADRRDERRNAEPEPEPEPVIVERRVGTIYVCRIVHDDGRIQELAAESLPELQRMATRAVGPSARLELGR